MNYSGVEQKAEAEPLLHRRPGLSGTSRAIFFCVAAFKTEQSKWRAFFTIAGIWIGIFLTNTNGRHKQGPGRRESGQSGGRGHVAAGAVQKQARGSAFVASFKDECVVGHLREEVLLAFGEQFKLRHSSQIARLLVRQL